MEGANSRAGQAQVGLWTNKESSKGACVARSDNTFVTPGSSNANVETNYYYGFENRCAGILELAMTLETANEEHRCSLASLQIQQPFVQQVLLDGSSRRSLLIEVINQFTADETEKLAKDLNGYFMNRDVVILEDHPDTPESVKGVKLNNGHYTLFLAQSLSKLNRFSKILEAGH